MATPRKKPGWAFWTVVVLMLPVLYVLSSGPMRTAIIRERQFPVMWVEEVRERWIGTESETYVVQVPVHQAPETNLSWWPQAYWPLRWASKQPWGKALKWYWGLFPIPSP